MYTHIHTYILRVHTVKSNTSSIASMCAYIHTYTYIRVHTHTYILRVGIFCSLLQAQHHLSRVCVCMYMYVYIHTYISRVGIFCSWLQALHHLLQACVLTYTHTHIHTCTHTHTYILRVGIFCSWLQAQHRLSRARLKASPASRPQAEGVWFPVCMYVCMYVRSCESKPCITASG
jgi:hypothetical protein